MARIGVGPLVEMMVSYSETWKVVERADRRGYSMVEWWGALMAA